MPSTIHRNTWNVEMSLDKWYDFVRHMCVCVSVLAYAP